MVCAGRTQSLCQILCPSCLCGGSRYKLPEVHLQRLSHQSPVHGGPSRWDQSEYETLQGQCHHSPSHCCADIHVQCCFSKLLACSGSMQNTCTQYTAAWSICSNTMPETLLNVSITCKLRMYSKLYSMLCMVVTLTAVNHEHSAHHPGIAQSPLFCHAVQMRMTYWRP